MHYDPQQELFTALKLAIEEKGYKVFDDGLPAENEPYPFIYLGATQQIDDENKTAIFGNVFQNLQIWHTAKNRGTLSAMLLDIKTICRSITKTTNFAWTVRNVTANIRNDKTTATPLIFADVNIEFYFS